MEIVLSCSLYEKNVFARSKSLFALNCWSEELEFVSVLSCQDSPFLFVNFLVGAFEGSQTI